MWEPSACCGDFKGASPPRRTPISARWATQTLGKSVSHQTIQLGMRASPAPQSHATRARHLNHGCSCTLQAHTAHRGDTRCHQFVAAGRERIGESSSARNSRRSNVALAKASKTAIAAIRCWSTDSSLLLRSMNTRMLGSVSSTMLSANRTATSARLRRSLRNRDPPVSQTNSPPSSCCNMHSISFTVAWVHTFMTSKPYFIGLALIFPSSHGHSNPGCHVSMHTATPWARLRVRHRLAQQCSCHSGVFPASPGSNGSTVLRWMCRAAPAARHGKGSPRRVLDAKAIEAPGLLSFAPVGGLSGRRCGYHLSAAVDRLDAGSAAPACLPGVTPRGWAARKTRTASCVGHTVRPARRRCALTTARRRVGASNRASCELGGSRAHVVAARLRAPTPGAGEFSCWLSA